MKNLRILYVALLICAIVILLFGCSLMIDDGLGHGHNDDSHTSVGGQVETKYKPTLYFGSEVNSAFSNGRYTPSYGDTDRLDFDGESIANDQEKVDGESMTQNEQVVGDGSLGENVSDGGLGENISDGDIEDNVHSEGSEQLPLKQIALTFDDGPDEEITPIILDHLAQYEAKATFFMLGYRVAAYPEIVQQVHDAGHEIGNHSWNHPQLTKLTSARILEQIVKTDEAIEAAIGIAPTLIRPPYGDVNKKVIDTVSGILVNWSIDTADWRDRDVEMIMQQIERKTVDGSIILMHDTYATTAEAVELILAKYDEEGYGFVTVSELLGFDVDEPVSGKVYIRKED